MTAARCLPDLPAGARILLIRLRSIGDIVLLTPSLRLLNEWRPDLPLTVIIETRFRELLESNPCVDELLSPGEGRSWRKIAARLGAVRELRRRKFSLCVNLHGGPTSTLFTRLSGARRKAGYEYYRSRGIYSFLIPHARALLGRDDVHTAEHQAAAFFYLGLPRTEIPRAEIFVRFQDRAWWEKQRAQMGLEGAREYALLHSAALYATKQWSAENFARLGDFLAREAHLAPVFSCGPGESAVLDAIERAAGHSLRRLEGASLGQFAAALEGARLFVGNDSGPAHMAAALARPRVVIFGSSSSTIWGPWPRHDAQAPARVVQNFYDCNPCPGDRCYRYERPECILSVCFEQVRSAVEEVLAASPQKREIP
jgi:lipopolysaccharide heptosyltransferase III